MSWEVATDQAPMCESILARAVRQRSTVGKFTGPAHSARDSSPNVDAMITVIEGKGALGNPIRRDCVQIFGERLQPGIGASLAGSSARRA